MAHTYNITPASINGGRRNSISTYWTNFQEGNGGGYVVGHSSAGYSSTYYRVVNFLFNSADLAQFSGKTITSIVLRIKVSSGTLGSTSYPYRVRYKYNDVASTPASSDAWASGTADGSAYDDTNLDTWSNGQGSGTTTIAANTTHDFDLGTTLPSYGYVIAGVSGSNAYMVLAEATLIVTTTETQRKLVYNANGGTGAPSTQTAWENPGTSHTFTVSNTTPTRTGFEFVSWNTSADGSGTSKTGGQTISVSSSTTLYAQWNALKSTLNTISAGTIGSSVSVSWTAKGSFSHKLKFTLGSATTSEVTIAAGTNSYTFSIPSSWLNQLPTTTSGTATAMLTTLVDGNAIGTDSKSFTVNVASSVVPSIGTVTATKVNTNPTVSSWDIYLQSYSQVKITANSLTAGTGATLSSVRFTGQNLDYTKSSPSSSENTTSNVITGNGSLTYTVKLTDSRGRTATKTVSISVTAYSPPTVTYMYGWRCDADGTPNWATGESLEAQVRFTYTAVGANTITNELSYKKTSDLLYTTAGTNIASDSVTIFSVNSAEITSTYDVKFVLTDSLGTTGTMIITISTVRGIAFGLKNDRARFGGVTRQAGLEVDWTTQFDENVIVKSDNPYPLRITDENDAKALEFINYNGQAQFSVYDAGVERNYVGQGRYSAYDSTGSEVSRIASNGAFLGTDCTIFGYPMSRGLLYKGAVSDISTDFNDITESGVYNTNGDTMTNAPTQYKWSPMLVYRGLAGGATQQIINPSYCYMRQLTGNPLAWTEWLRWPLNTSYGDLSHTGETQYIAPANVSIATGTWTTVASVTLATGTWLLMYVGAFGTNSTGVRRMLLATSADSSSTSVGAISEDNRNALVGLSTSLQNVFYYKATSQTTLYLNVWQNSGSTLTGFGRIRTLRIC